MTAPDAELDELVAMLEEASTRRCPCIAVGSPSMDEAIVGPAVAAGSGAVIRGSFNEVSLPAQDTRAAALRVFEMRYLADDVGLLLVAVGFLFLVPGAACTAQSLDPLVQSCTPGIACGLRISSSKEVSPA